MATDRDRRPFALELFAGVGGFRLALERAGWRVRWSNQWEPSTRVQHASACYVAHFGAEGHACEDIASVLDAVERGERELPHADLVVGGFPCQDYSVAQRSARQRHGIRGEKGALWWEVHRLLRLRRPPLFLLENVDRLLKSPARQPGRDFALVLASLGDLGYQVEWRVVNAADYGFPQRRRRLLLAGRHAGGAWDAADRLRTSGVLARALPVDPASAIWGDSFVLAGDLDELFRSFGAPERRSPFRTAGSITGRRVWTADLRPAYAGTRMSLGDLLEPHDSVAERYFIPDAQLPTWRRLKAAKRMERVHRRTGTRYLYAEGAMRFPDPPDQPSRTIVTIEGGSTPSRFTHVVGTPDGRYRRLTPRELERLNGFPDDWTDTGMPHGRRAFMMGNALVVGLMERVARELRAEVGGNRGEAENAA